jgi:lipopolysaccharide transport system ATP-binding protein
MSCDEIAIRVTNLSKRYEIYATPRDRLKQLVLPRLQRHAGWMPRQYFREFWALTDVSFEIGKGETVGIIGRNGSGKSTLLQTICGTLNPTCGAIQTNGRIAALLELGSGFNPEFTGRENVHMNAAVLGLSQQQIDARFDRIAAFADIGEFIDHSVKTYSSGMMVRLAFAVIAHVDADILVIDEALSVGDAVFTQKCMRFIRTFQERGTLLFVSHDMGSVQNLCRSAIWLNHGRVEKIGASKAVSQAYLQYTLQEIYGGAAKLNPTAPARPADHGEDAKKDSAGLLALDYGSRYLVADNLGSSDGWATGDSETLSIHFKNINGETSTSFEGGEKVRVVIRALANVDMARPILGFLVKDRLGQDLFGENTLPFTAQFPCSVCKGQEFEGEFVFRLPMLPNGEYAVMASVADGDLHKNVQHHYLHQALIINVTSSKIRWGLVGIPFERVTLKVFDDEK